MTTIILSILNASFSQIYATEIAPLLVDTPHMAPCSDTRSCLEQPQPPHRGHENVLLFRVLVLLPGDGDLVIRQLLQGAVTVAVQDRWHRLTTALRIGVSPCPSWCRRSSSSSSCCCCCSSSSAESLGGWSEQRGSRGRQS